MISNRLKTFLFKTKIYKNNTPEKQHTYWSVFRLILGKVVNNNNNNKKIIFKFVSINFCNHSRTVIVFFTLHFQQ